jgi:hypothetical protein
LDAASPVLAEIIDAGATTRADVGKGMPCRNEVVVRISDAVGEDVERMMQFIYFSTLDPAGSHDLPALLRLGDKYDIGPLVEWCCCAMILRLDDSSAVSYMRMLRMLKAHPMIGATMEILTTLVARDPKMQIAVMSEI